MCFKHLPIFNKFHPKADSEVIYVSSPKSSRRLPVGNKAIESNLFMTWGYAKTGT